MKAIHALPKAERYDAVRPFQSRLCAITYRNGTYGKWQTEQFRVVGAAHHRTNGNSTGDLIVAPANPDNVFVIGDVRIPLQSISLANLKSLEAVESVVR